MINPPTRPYLPEEIERIKFSEFVETKKLPDISLENKIPVTIISDSAKPTIKKVSVIPKVLLIGGSIVVVVGIIAYFSIKHYNQKKSKEATKTEKPKN